MLFLIKERDCFILNSTTNTPKLLDRLARYGQIYCYLDNDGTSMRTISIYNNGTKQRCQTTIWDIKI